MRRLALPARSKPPGRGHPLRSSALKTVTTLRRSQPKHAAPRDTGADLALIALVPYAVAGYRNGVVELTCTRCGTPKAFGLADEDVVLSDLAVWGQDHRCQPAAASVKKGSTAR